LYMRLGGPQGRSGQVRKISTPPELDPRTVQPVASRHKRNENWWYIGAMLVIGKLYWCNASDRETILVQC
jgi:hypothetical protein